MSPKKKRIISILLKSVIVTLASFFIYRKLNNNQNLENFNNLLLDLPRTATYITLTLVFILMFLNWFTESLKWKFLLKPVERISTLKAVESVFCGLTWAIFTPNRIGEFGGRVFFLSPRKRVLGVIAMLVGAVSQLMITNILGAVSVLWFIGRFVPLNFWLHYAIAFLVMVFCMFFLLFYFNMRWLNNLLLSFDFFKQFRQLLGILTRYPRPALFKIFLYSLFRFAVFTSQYCLVISLLIPGIHIGETCLMVFILFFVQSALPSLDLLDIGVRSMTATYFFSFITDQEVAIIASTAVIWLINLVLPAIIGTLFVFKLNFFGNSDR